MDEVSEIGLLVYVYYCSDCASLMPLLYSEQKHGDFVEVGIHVDREQPAEIVFDSCINSSDIRIYVVCTYMGQFDCVN